MQLEQAFHIWYYGTRIELAYFELAAALATKTIRLMTVSEELVRTAKKNGPSQNKSERSHFHWDYLAIINK